MNMNVFPLNADKTPMLHGTWKGSSKPREDWDVEAPLWGIECGPASGIFVIDIDAYKPDFVMPPELADLPATHTAKTMRGGTHHYFQWEPGVTNAGAWPGVDIRGVGGYVVSYGDLPDLKTVSKAPAWLVERLKGSTRTNYSNAPVPALSVDLDRLRGMVPDDSVTLLDEIAPQGGRSEAIYRLICDLARTGWDIEEAFMVMTTCANVVDKNVPDASLWKQVQKGFREAGAAFSIWEQRPELRAVNDWANARMVSPWAVLGNALSRVLTTIPPHVQTLSNTRGSGSLNSYFCIVGQPHAGKTQARKVAEEAFVMPSAVYRFTPGTDSALVDRYAKQNAKTGVLEWARDSALVYFDEISLLTSLTERKGNGLAQFLLTAWVGDQLGLAYRSAGLSVELPENSYRLNMVVNGQYSATARALFTQDAIGTGLPHRFVFLTAHNDAWRQVDARTLRPHKVPAVDWTHKHHVQAPPSAEAAMFAEQLAGMSSTGDHVDELDGHMLFARLKIAVAFMALAGRTDCSDEDWELAGQVIEHSKRQRRQLQAHSAHASRQSALTAAKVAGEVEAVKAEYQATATTQRVAQRLLNRSADVLTWTTRKELKNFLGRDKGYLDDTLTYLTETDTELTEWASALLGASAA